MDQEQFNLFYQYMCQNTNIYVKLIEEKKEIATTLLAAISLEDGGGAGGGG